MSELSAIGLLELRRVNVWRGTMGKEPVHLDDVISITIISITLD
jgi:hypothetical protein